MSDFEKFKEELSSKEKFYSSLPDRKINDKECGHVLNVWNKFEMKTMKDYDYLSAPSLSWDAMLKITKVKLELISDPDMFIFFDI